MNKIFLIRYEDGTVCTVSNSASGFLHRANDGELDIIDITDPNTPKLFFDNFWRTISTAYDLEGEGSLGL